MGIWPAFNQLVVPVEHSGFCLLYAILTEHVLPMPLVEEWDAQVGNTRSIVPSRSAECRTFRESIIDFEEREKLAHISKRDRSSTFWQIPLSRKVVARALVVCPYLKRAFPCSSKALASKEDVCQRWNDERVSFQRRTARELGLPGRQSPFKSMYALLWGSAKLHSFSG